MTGKTVSPGSVDCRWTGSFHANAALVGQLEKWPSTDLINGLISTGAHVSWYYPAQTTSVVICLTSWCTVLQPTLSSDLQFCQDIEMGIVFFKGEEVCRIMTSRWHKRFMFVQFFSIRPGIYMFFWLRKYHDYVIANVYITTLELVLDSFGVILFHKDM